MQQDSPNDKINSTVEPKVPEELAQKIRFLSEKPQESILRSEALSIVRELWPAAFKVSTPKPLKIGIHKDIQAAGLLPDHVIEMAIKYFVSRDRYLECTREGCHRIDLNGRRTGRVNIKEAIRADMILYSRYQRKVRHTLSDNPIFLGKMRLISIINQKAVPQKMRPKDSACTVKADLSSDKSIVTSAPVESEN